MSRTINIIGIDPDYSIPGGEIAVESEGFTVTELGTYGCYIGGQECRIVAASSKRILAIVPEGIETAYTHLHLESPETSTNLTEIVVGERLVDDMTLAIWLGRGSLSPVIWADALTIKKAPTSREADEYVPNRLIEIMANFLRI